jgi:uncharacterized protein
VTLALALALALGAVIGVLLGLLGGGGSILAVPALVYALGLGVEQAIPISLIVIGIASAAGALPKVPTSEKLCGYPSESSIWPLAIPPKAL